MKGRPVHSLFGACAAGLFIAALALMTAFAAGAF